MAAHNYFSNLKKEYEERKLEFVAALAAIEYTPRKEKEYKPPTLPLSTRFEGLWMVGRQGSGKTAWFKDQATRDLDMVAAGQASMVILDPIGCNPPIYDRAGELVSPASIVHAISRLSRFAKGGDL